MRASRLLVAACAWLALLGGGATAQLTPRGQPRPLSSPWSGLRGDGARLILSPAFDAFAVGASRAGLDAGITWQRTLTGDRFARLGLDFGAARRAGSTYRRTGVAASYGLERERLTAALTVSAALGSGQGPVTVFSAEASGHAGVLRMNVRTSLLRDEPNVSLDSVPLPGLPGQTAGTTARHTDAELSADHRLGLLHATATFGARFGEDIGEQPQWAHAQVLAPLHGRLGLQLAAGWQPERRDLAQPAGAFARIALRLEVRSGEAAPASTPAPAVPAALRVAALEPGRYRLSIACGAARSVQIKGDLTDWEPLDMRPAGASPGHCSTVLRATPGVYHVVLRTDDGPWAVPPGLTPVPDGFGGLAGLLSIT